MIYMEPSTLGWRPHVESWITTCNAEWMEPVMELVMDLFDWLVPPCLHFVEKQCKQLCNAGLINLVKTAFQVFEMTMEDAWTESTKKEEDSKYLVSWAQAAMIHAGVWGLAAILDTSSREKFDVLYRTLWTGADPERPYPESMEKLEISLPYEGLFFDYYYVYKLKGLSYTIATMYDYTLQVALFNTVTSSSVGRSENCDLVILLLY